MHEPASAGKGASCPHKVTASRTEVGGMLSVAPAAGTRSCSKSLAECGGHATKVTAQGIHALEKLLRCASFSSWTLFSSLSGCVVVGRGVQCIAIHR